MLLKSLVARWNFHLSSFSNWCKKKHWKAKYDFGEAEGFKINNNHLYYNDQKIISKFNSFESYYRLISYLLFTYISVIEIKVSAALTFFHIQRIAWTVCNFSRLSKFWASTGYFFIFIGAILPWHFDRCNCKKVQIIKQRLRKTCSGILYSTWNIIVLLLVGFFTYLEYIGVILWRIFVFKLLI